MRIKKREIQERIDPSVVANKASEIVDAVADELDSDDETAKSFVKSMTMSENADTNHVVEYDSDKTGEEPFIINDTKWVYVWGRYPGGKKDIAVYRFGHDICYDYNWFQEVVIPKPNNSKLDEESDEIFNRRTKYGVKSEPSLSKRDREELGIGEPKRKINYNEKDFSFDDYINEYRRVVKVIKVKDLK